LSFRRQASTQRSGVRLDPFLMLAVRTIREPVLQDSPFVMNTRKKIEQAINDYQNGPERTQARLFKTACLEL
jgi:redox-sensitive bicupin YhaK (pirin superfamily)